jgi:hypothetical protein
MNIAVNAQGSQISAMNRTALSTAALSSGDMQMINTLDRNYLFVRHC